MTLPIRPRGCQVVVAYLEFGLWDDGVVDAVRWDGFDIGPLAFDMCQIYLLLGSSK